MPLAYVALFFVLAATLMFLPTIIGSIWGLLVWMGPAGTELSIGLILAALIIWAAGKKKK
ncbi:hypothetical protein HYU90_03160 [Candidatus Collierbacteria bacterium]|nr:hypothetical protein [Candidatus Collierbacteria bacterium]